MFSASTWRRKPAQLYFDYSSRGKPDAGRMQPENAMLHFNVGHSEDLMLSTGR